MANARRARREAETIHLGALLVLTNGRANTKVRQLNPQLMAAAQAAEFLGDSLSYVHRATGAIVSLRQMETKNQIASLLGLRRGVTAEVMSLRRGYAMGGQKLLRAPPGRMFGRVRPRRV
jgi:hypothetical protein